VEFPTYGAVPAVDNPVERDRAHREAVGGAVQLLRSAITSKSPFFIRPPSSEIVKVYPQRGFVTREEWRTFIRSAKTHLWLYGMAEGGYARDEDTAKTLSRVPADCDVRVLLLDPECAYAIEIDEDEQAAQGTLCRNALTALGRFAAMRSVRPNQVKIRVYTSFPQVSIVRSDSRLLVTNYIRPLAGDDCPTLEIHGRHEDNEGLFDRYARNFYSVWSSAKEWP
jgi:hypothetical protein